MIWTIFRSYIYEDIHITSYLRIFFHHSQIPTCVECAKDNHQDLVGYNRGHVCNDFALKLNENSKCINKSVSTAAYDCSDNEDKAREPFETIRNAFWQI